MSSNKGGKGDLTFQCVVKLSTYDRKPIMDFVTQSKDVENIKSAVKESRF